ncbi:MAG: 2-amino-4-hydroxy-6-hydroxymethyldihydropteridine diphosphokinase [Bacteroidia bacterium]|nr:2-amino-4-hydroxy-6-hydroxymethyldihydropteridine diphosphokinase [Bacteroidia bacterium]MCF8427535.1 2-amino-4-hydroxy-6-hydroxymethyldihydropteridine diphosphokinase [Bacteroidia bacterium]MCF8447152.1 2-amino-4-hydroxy-6-hydroxymethyldihydropteridine diphosphokinase [Bacteroidia bacterium]
MTNNVYILLGSNQGDSKENLANACLFIKERIGLIQTKSSIYRTAAWGNTEQNPFLNQVLLVQTELKPMDCLNNLLQIETEMGRIRKEKWEPRVIDLDILFYNSEILNFENLIVPHPFIAQRRFTLIPLVEISPNYVHPKLNKTLLELLEICEDSLNVEKLP